MPREGKIKIQWIMEKNARQAAFRKRRDTLIQKVRELSILCSVSAAVVVYGRGESEPKFWPEAHEEVAEILRRYRDLPDASKEAHRLDNEAFVRKRTQNMKRKVDNYKAITRGLEVNLILNDISLGRPREFDDLPRELTSAVVSALDALRDVTADRLKSIRSGGGPDAAEVPPPVEEAAAFTALQEPLMVQPLAMAGPITANAPLVQPPAPPQSELVVPVAAQEEPPMVSSPAMMMAPVTADEPLLLLAPPLSELVVEPAPAPLELPMVADAPLLLPAAEPDPQATAAAAVGVDAPILIPAAETERQATAAAGVGVDTPLDLDAEPWNGSFLLEMADAIIDDGSGRQATAEDVDRLLKEHGLEHFKPM